MNKKMFSTLHVSGLTIDDLYALTKSTIELATPVKDSIGDLPGAALAQMEADNTSMNARMNRSLKNVLTNQLSGLDKERDDRFAEIKRNVSTNVKGRDEAKKNASTNLKTFLAPYWDAFKKPLNTQTGLFSDLLEKYNADEALQADATTIGITDMLTGLKDVNDQFNELYKARNSQEAQTGPSASSLKSDVVHSYEDFSDALEHAVNYTPSDTLTTLFNDLEELRKKYITILNRKDEEEQAPAEPAGTA